MRKYRVFKGDGNQIQLLSLSQFKYNDCILPKNKNISIEIINGNTKRTQTVGRQYWLYLLERMNKRSKSYIINFDLDKISKEKKHYFYKNLHAIFDPNPDWYSDSLYGGYSFTNRTVELYFNSICK